MKEGGAANGRIALAVTPTQVFSAQLPGWHFPIAADPKPGEYRWLRINWRKDGPGGLMFQLASNGAWNAQTARFHSGPNELNWPGQQLEKNAPKQWTSETIDLHAAFGGATTLTGLALVPMFAGTGWFDAIYLARTRDDLDAIQRSAAGIAAIPRPPGAVATGGDDAVAPGRLEVFVNGTLAWRGDGLLPTGSPVPTLRPLAELLQAGRNVVALHATRGTANAAFDVAIIDQTLLARVAGDPTRPAAGERFATQVEFTRNGTVPVRALVRIAAPPDKQPPEQLLLGSNELAIPIREALDPDLLAYAGDPGRNLLGPNAANASASSRFTPDFEPALALDNLVHRGWLAADGDQKPLLAIELRKPVRADTVLIAPIQQRHFEPDRQRWKVRRVEVSIDRGKGGTYEVLLPADGRKGKLLLPRAAVIRRLDVRILDTAERPVGKSAVGLSEVELQLSATKSSPPKPPAGK